MYCFKIKVREIVSSNHHVLSEAVQKINGIFYDKISKEIMTKGWFSESLVRKLKL